MRESRKSALWRPHNFWRQAVEDEDGCWIWQRSCNAGYGHLKGPGGHDWMFAHHYAWFLTRGSWPKVGYQEDGKHWVIGHRCDNKRCINPDHLENITTSQNNRDCWKRIIRPQLEAR